MQTPMDNLRKPWPTLGVLAIFFGLSLIFQIETLLVPPRSDSAAFLYMGARQEAGQMPGRDLWDNKLPLIYLVGRAAMATQAPRATLWIFEAALTALGAFAVYSLLASSSTPRPSEPHPSGSGQCPQATTDRDLGEASDSKLGGRAVQNRIPPYRPALAAGILLCIISGSPANHAGGFMSEIYAMPLSAVAAWLAWQTFTQQRSARFGIVAGLCGVLAISFRLPLALSAAGVLLASILAARRSPPAHDTSTCPKTPLPLGERLGEGASIPVTPLPSGERLGEGLSIPQTPLPLGERLGEGETPSSIRPSPGRRPEYSTPSACPSLAREGGEIASQSHRVNPTFARACPPACMRTCIATHTLGAMLGLVLVFIHPLCAGYFSDCLNAAILWPLGLTGKHMPGPLTLSTAERLADFAQDFVKLGYLHLTALAGLALALRGPNRRLARMIGLWYVTAIASAAFGWASYAHYQYVAFAPACAAVGLLLHHVRTVPAKKIAVGLTALAAIVVGIQNVKEVSRHAAFATDAAQREIVEFIQTQAKPGDTVYVWAWNRRASLLYELDHPPGNRHFMAHSYFNMDLSLFDEMVESFTANPPTWLVIDRNRNKPLPIGPAPTSWEHPIPSLARLREFIETHYHKAVQYGDMMILHTP